MMPCRMASGLAVALIAIAGETLGIPGYAILGWCLSMPSGAACLQAAGREQREPMGRRAVMASGRGVYAPWKQNSVELHSWRGREKSYSIITGHPYREPERVWYGSKEAQENDNCREKGKGRDQEKAPGRRAPAAGQAKIGQEAVP